MSRPISRCGSTTSATCIWRPEDEAHDEARRGDAGGDEQPARRDRRGDGRRAGPDRLLAQHQGAPRFFVRAVRRRRRAGRAGRPYTGPSRLDAAFGARRDRAAGTRPGRRRRGQRSVRRRHPSAGPDAGRADFPRQRAPPVRVRRQPRPSRRYRRDGAGLDGARRPRFTRRASACRRCKSCGRANRSRDVLELFFANTRVREEREGDLRAQIAALDVGAARLARAGGGERAQRMVAAAMDGAQELLGPADARDASPVCARASTARSISWTTTASAPGRSRIRVAIRIGGGTRDRRFHRIRAAGARPGQRQLRDHAVGDLLRDEMPGGRSGAGQRRPDARRFE